MTFVASQRRTSSKTGLHPAFFSPVPCRHAVARHTTHARESLVHAVFVLRLLLALPRRVVSLSFSLFPSERPCSLKTCRGDDSPPFSRPTQTRREYTRKIDVASSRGRKPITRIGCRLRVSVCVSTCVLYVCVTRYNALSN